MLSDQDIKKILNKEIVIHPYRETDLTGLGYNLNPSDFVFSINQQELLKSINGFFHIEPQDTVLILTEEAVWVSKKIAGTFHSKVGVVSAGFGHISTTLDPEWKGPLLISLNNPTAKPLKLAANKSFVTLIFYQVRTPALKKHDNSPNRSDILKEISDEMLANGLNQQGTEFVKKVQSLIANENINEEFEQKYQELSKEFYPILIPVIKRSFQLQKLDYFKHLSLRIFQYGLSILLILKIISLWADKITIQATPHPFFHFINQTINKSDTIALAAVLFTALQVKSPYKHKI